VFFVFKFFSHTNFALLISLSTRCIFEKSRYGSISTFHDLLVGFGFVFIRCAVVEKCELIGCVQFKNVFTNEICLPLSQVVSGVDE